MSAYEYERDYPRRYVREERREERDPRYLETREYRTSHRELVPREPRREDSDLSIEEIRREFPPPTGSRDIRRARSAEPYYEDDYYDDYRRDRDYDRRSRRGMGSRTPSYYEEERGHKSKHKAISKEEKIMAAVAGAALLAGGKELYDRHEAKEDRGDVQRNMLSSAALAGVGAFAAYQGAEFYNKQQAKKDQKATYILHRGRDGHVSEYYSDDDDDRKGNKNFLESALAATGLGAAVKSLTGGGDKDDRSDTRSRRSSRSRSRSRGDGANKMQKAAMASLLAGATEAFRVSREPGSWKGEKAKRVMTAAAGAATVDAAQDADHGKLGMVQSVIGGLVGNRLVNGSKDEIEEDKATGRSRSRSRARSRSRSRSHDGGGGAGLAALATAGLGAIGAKKAYDAHQSRSRSRSRRDDDDDYYSRDGSPDRRRNRSRSRSVVDKARNSLAKLGIGSAATGAAAADDDRRRTQDDFDDRVSSRRARRYSDDMYDDAPRSRRGGDARDYYDDERSYRSGRRDRPRGGRSDYTSESDLGDSSDDEKQAKKMKDRRY